MRQLNRTQLTLTLLAFALSVCLPSWAHDPLRDHDRARHERTHHHIAHPTHNLDLEAVRTRVEAFREAGDDRELDAAWALIEPALRDEPVAPVTLIMAAQVAQARHEFSMAL